MSLIFPGYLLARLVDAKTKNHLYHQVNRVSDRCAIVIFKLRFKINMNVIH